MPSISRRDCLKSIVATAALSSLPMRARTNPLGLPLGCQTWPVRESIAKDFPATIKTLAAAGFQSIELSHVNGKRTYDLLLELLDPKLVKFQFQVSTIADGYDVAEYLTKYPTRFISMHVQGWDLKKNTYAVVGQDSLDWKKIFSAAKSANIKNYFVEMNLDLMRASVPYLRSLQV